MELVPAERSAAAQAPSTPLLYLVGRESGRPPLFHPKPEELLEKLPVPAKNGGQISTTNRGFMRPSA